MGKTIVVPKVTRGVPLQAQVLGAINGSGKVTVVDARAPPGAPTPVDLDLDKVLGKMPSKTFKFQRQQPVMHPFSLPQVPPEVGLLRCSLMKTCHVGYESYSADCTSCRNQLAQDWSSVRPLMCAPCDSCTK